MMLVNRYAIETELVSEANLVQKVVKIPAAYLRVKQFGINGDPDGLIRFGKILR